MAEDGGRVTMRLAREGFLKRLEIHFEIKPEQQQQQAAQQGKQQQGKRREEQEEEASPLAAAGAGRPVGCVMQVRQGGWMCTAGRGAGLCIAWAAT